MKSKKPTAKDRMKAQGFQEASQSDMIRAKNNATRGQRRKVDFEYVAYSGDGVMRKVDAPPKDGFFREAKLRHKHMTPKRKKLKMKTEIWNQAMLANLFRTEEIHADEPKGWTIYLNNPARKMTAADQLHIMLKDSDLDYEVQVNHNEKHMVIEDLHPTN